MFCLCAVQKQIFLSLDIVETSIKMEYSTATGIKGGGAFTVHERLRRLVYDDVRKVRNLCRNSSMYVLPNLKADLDNATYHYNRSNIFVGVHMTAGCRKLSNMVKPTLSSVFDFVNHCS